MGLESVTDNVDAYLQAGLTSGAIDGLAKVYAWPPDVTPEGTFTVPSEGPSHRMGTVLYMHLVRPSRNRVAVGGPNSGIKKVRYDLTFFCFTRSAGREAQMVGRQAQQFFDSLTAYIEANRTANSNLSGQPIFQIGEGSTLGGDDLPVIITLPRSIRQGVKQTFGTMTAVVLEFVYT